MVTISPETYNDPEFSGPLSSYLLYLYEQLSQDPFPAELDIPNETWKEFINIAYDCNKQEYPKYNIKPELIPPYTYDKPDYHKVMVALSGGKDSVSTLLRLKDEGKDVVAYFMKKANISYMYEEDCATKIAGDYNIPIIKDTLGRKGKTDFFENPVKNQLIIARMLEWGIKRGYAVVALGEVHDDLTSLDKIDIQHNLDDYIEFSHKLESAIQTHISEFRLDYVFKTEGTDMSYIITKHLEVVPDICSCLMPTRYLKQQLKYVEKYHLHADPFKPDEEGIMPRRCMMCWKCIEEYIFLVLWGKLPLDKVYMKEKAIPQLLKHRHEIDNQLSTKSEKEITLHEILDALCDIDLIKEYTKDPSLIMKDIYHYHPELEPEALDEN